MATYQETVDWANRQTRNTPQYRTGQIAANILAAAQAQQQAKEAEQLKYAKMAAEGYPVQEQQRSGGLSGLLQALSGKPRYTVDPMKVQTPQQKQAAQLSQLQQLMGKVGQGGQMAQGTSGGYKQPTISVDSSGNISYSLKPNEPSAAEEKREVQARELKGQAQSLIQQFQRARQEAEGGFTGRGGIEGRLGGMWDVAKGKLGYSPAVNTYQDKIKAFATTVAKAAGEQRPTDQDIERFIATLPTLGKSDKENQYLIESLINDLNSMGAGMTWEGRTAGSSAPNLSGGIVPAIGQMFQGEKITNVEPIGE